MKHIKLYERVITRIRKSWKVPTGDKYLIALKKIGCDDQNLEELANTNIFMYNNRYVYILYDEGSDWNDWSWSGNEKWEGLSNYDYQGEVIVEDWEVAAKKYNV